ncbi:hypothetical protein Tco_1379699 [Tanacetum coccineum]
MKDKSILPDYPKLNKLYESFVPQTEIPGEQTYLSPPSTSIISHESSLKKSDLPLKKMPNESQLLKLFVNLDNEIKELGKLINIHHYMDRDKSFFYDNKADIRNIFTLEEMLEICETTERKVDEQSQQDETFQKEIDQLLEASREVKDCVLIFVEQQKNEMLILGKEKISNESKDIQSSKQLLKRIQILKNDFKRSQAQRFDFKLKLQHQKEKNAYDISWKSKMAKLNDKNVQHQREVDKLIENVNQKTYTYGDVRAKNQDLLMIISELKDKLKTAEKGTNVNTKFGKFATLGKLLCVTLMNKNKDLKANMVSKVEVKTDKSKPVTSCSIPKNEQGVASSSSVGRPESKEISIKRDTLNLNVSESNANVLNAKTVNAVNDGSNLVCVSCGKDVFMISHEKCVALYALFTNSRVKRALLTSLVTMKSSQVGATPVVAKSRFSVAPPSKAINKVIQLILWIVDSGCSKHISGNLKLLRNLIEKFMGTVHFSNDHFATMIRYGDYVQGNLTICHVYYVEGLEHNLFSIRQFCDGDLEVAFRCNTCFIQNLEGEDLLTSSRDSNLYTIFISEMPASSLLCLMSKATSKKSWLWHRQLSHLNFGTINHLTK